MNSVTVSRRIGAAPGAVRAAMNDVRAFMRAGGFDEVAVDGDRIELTNGVGIATIELTLAVVDAPDAGFAYEQREGIFESMRTTYAVEPRDGGAEVTATTEFAVDVALVADLMDATVIERQRRRELEAQFDWLESAATG